MKQIKFFFFFISLSRSLNSSQKDLSGVVWKACGHVELFTIGPDASQMDREDTQVALMKARRLRHAFCLKHSHEIKMLFYGAHAAPNFRPCRLVAIQNKKSGRRKSFRHDGPALITPFV